MLATVHDTVVKIDPRILQIASGLVIPLLVGLITKVHAAKGLKAGLNLLLSAIAGGVTTLVAGNGTILLSTWAWGMLQTFVTSIVSYYGLWKPTGVAANVQAVAPDKGLGQQHPEQYVNQVPPEVPEPVDAIVPPPPPPPPPPAKPAAKPAAKPTAKRKR